MFGAAGIIMPIFVMLSTFGAANGSLYAGGRSVFHPIHKLRIATNIEFNN